MLTPEYLQDLPDVIVQLWSEAERAILADMARRLAKYNYWIPAVDHQAARLQAAGRTREDILQALTRIMPKTRLELQEMMVEAGSRCLRSDIGVYTSAGLKTPKLNESKALTDILNSGYQATAQTMQNLCRVIPGVASQQFVEVLDQAWGQISSGAFDYQSAIRSAINKLCSSGVRAIVYPSGHKDQIEVAVRRAVITGINQTSSRLQLELADEVGSDLVEVSAHAGARPSHAVWQGKIYSISGKSEKYPSFRQATGYGTVTGLAGVNCRHTFGPWIEGSSRVWTDEELEKLKEKKYEYKGEKLTEYEASQRQRYHERQIRRWKREQAAMEAAGQDSSEAAAKVRAWEARQREFLSATGLKRDYEREQIPQTVKPKMLPEVKKK